MRIRGLVRELVEAPAPLLILAHSASGTSWLNRVMQECRRPFHHEHVNPHRRGPGSDLITWKLAAKEIEARRHVPEATDQAIAFAAVWHMTRDPFAHVWSAAALFAKDGTHKERLCKVLGLKPRKSDLATAMRTIPAFHRRADKYRDRVFRVEDVAWDLPHENTHAYAGEKSWEALRKESKDLTRALERCREELGYDGG